MLCIISNEETQRVLYKHGKLADLQKWATIMKKEGDKVYYFSGEKDSGANKLGLKYESKGGGILKKLFDRRK